MGEVERRYALVKLGVGDYLLPPEHRPNMNVSGLELYR